MLNVGWVSSIHWIDWLKTMSEQPSKLACFMAELRRRHVFRVAVGYAAVAAGVRAAARGSLRRIFFCELLNFYLEGNFSARKDL